MNQFEVRNKNFPFFNAQAKKGEERDECERKENDKRHEVEIEEKERKEAMLSKTYKKKVNIHLTESNIMSICKFCC